jgi:hypothetical protein
VKRHITAVNVHHRCLKLHTCRVNTHFGSLFPLVSSPVIARLSNGGTSFNGGGELPDGESSLSLRRRASSTLPARNGRVSDICRCTP